MQTSVPSSKEFYVAYSKESKDGDEARGSNGYRNPCISLLQKPAWKGLFAHVFTEDLTDVLINYTNNCESLNYRIRNRPLFSCSPSGSYSPALLSLLLVPLALKRSGYSTVLRNKIFIFLLRNKIMFPINLVNPSPNQKKKPKKKKKTKQNQN